MNNKNIRITIDNTYYCRAVNLPVKFRYKLKNPIRFSVVVAGMILALLVIL